MMGSGGLACRRDESWGHQCHRSPNLAWGQAISSSVSVLDGTSAWHPPVLPFFPYLSHWFIIKPYCSQLKCLCPLRHVALPRQTLWNGLSHSFLFHLLQNNTSFSSAGYNLSIRPITSGHAKVLKAFSYEAFLLWFLIAAWMASNRDIFFLCHVSWRVSSGYERVPGEEVVVWRWWPHLGSWLFFAWNIMGTKRWNNGLSQLVEGLAHLLVK